MIDTIKKPLLWHKLRQLPDSVLIRTGEGDEALCYQATIEPMRGTQSFIVCFHLNSLLVERVRLCGSLIVLVDFASGESFVGNLMPPEERLDLKMKEMKTMLVLELNKRNDIELAHDVFLRPLT